VIDRTRVLKDILWILVFCGLVAMGFRLWFGLGATTGLSDAVPWGIWKIFNMVAGVALSTGGFTIGFLVYVLKMEEFRSLVKPAILIAFLGYGSSVFALILDIGIPYRIWHPIIMWNEHSFLFEVAWCVMLYFTVTIIELSPTVMERLHLSRVSHFLHKITYCVVLLGITLSCLHHSSLGSLFLVTPQRLHPLWFTPRLPILFIVSAMGTGLLVVLLFKILYSRISDPESNLEDRFTRLGKCDVSSADTGTWVSAPEEMPMLKKLGGIGTSILCLYFVLKMIDVFWTDAHHILLKLTWESWLYIFELLLISVIPMVLFLIPKIRNSSFGLCSIALSAVLGLILNRLNVGIFGYFRDAGTIYFPSLAEWILSIGIISGAGLLFLFVAEQCAIFDEKWEKKRESTFNLKPAFDKLSGVCNLALTSGIRRVTLVGVLVVPLAWVFLYPPYTVSSSQIISPPIARDENRSILEIDGNKNGVSVLFKHKEHRRRLGGKKTCHNCHHLSIPRDHSTPCSRCHRSIDRTTNIFDHPNHIQNVTKQKNLRGTIPANHACVVCHDNHKPKLKKTAKVCHDCHKENMIPKALNPERVQLTHACSYRLAMHKNCIACHIEEGMRLNRPLLGECATCHKTFKEIEHSDNTILTANSTGISY